MLKISYTPPSLLAGIAILLVVAAWIYLVTWFAVKSPHAIVRFSLFLASLTLTFFWTGAVHSVWTGSATAVPIEALLLPISFAYIFAVAPFFAS